MHTRLKTIIEENTTVGGRSFDGFILALVVHSLVGYAVETTPGMDMRTRQLLRCMEIAIVAIFTVEYLLRIAVADQRREFVFSSYGVVASALGKVRDLEANDANTRVSPSPNNDRAGFE